MRNINELVEEYSNNIYKYLICLTHSKDIAEELTQETLYRAIKHINQLKDDTKIELWLCKIAKNLWLQDVQRKKRYINISDNNLIKMKSEIDIEEDLIQSDNINILYANIDRLDDISKEIILLRLNGDLKFKEIGGIYGKTENWARIMFHRAKQQIMKEVRENEKKDRV